MQSKRIIVWGLTLVAVFAVYVFSGHTQVNLDYLKKQVEREQGRAPRPQEQPPPRPEQARPAEPVQDLNALRMQVQQLQERLIKLEKEVQDLRKPKMIPINRP